MRRASRLLLAFLAPLAVAAAVFLVPGLSSKKAVVVPAGAGPSAAEPDPSGRTSSESRAAAEALAALPRDQRAPALRMAEDEDAAPSPERADLDALYGTYHPYFVRGDLNGDGRTDFAQAFVETGPGGWFHVAVFLGKADGGFEKPVWIEKAVSLAAGDLSIERTILIVVPDLSLDDARRWRWDPVDRKFVDADATSGLRDDADDTSPDGPPRVRV